MLEHADRSRKSFAIYMYTRERPADEIAPEHGTIYVQSGLAPELVEGHTLTAEDVEGLKANFARRNRYLQAIYDREKAFSRVVEDLKSALAAAEQRPPLPFCGYADIASIGAPAYPDGWLGEHFALALQPLQPARGVAIDLWRNDAPDEPIGYVLSAGGRETRGQIDRDGPQQIQLTWPRSTLDPLDVDLRFTGCRSPRERGFGSDVRPLSFVLQRIELLH